MIITNKPLIDLSSHKTIIFSSNGSLKKDGANVMGKGFGNRLYNLVPNIAFTFGRHIKLHGNHPLKINLVGKEFISLPTKANYWGDVDINLIKDGLLRIVNMGIQGDVALEIPHSDELYLFVSTLEKEDLKFTIYN